MPGLFCERWVRWNSPYINHFISADTIIPEPSNPQSWNRYSYAVNNPIKYNDPDGHCAPACAVPVVVGIAAIAVVTAAFYVAITPAAHEYVSKRVLDVVDDFERNVADTNNGKKFPLGRCGSSVKMASICIGGAFLIGKAIIDSGEKGGCGEDGSNVSCPSSSTLIPSSTLTNTPSPTLMPTLTNTVSPTLTPSPTLAPSRTPTKASTRLPSTVRPVFKESIWERRLLMKNLE
jgi:hypothetical protein